MSNVNQKETVKIMPAGLPFLAAGITWFWLAAFVFFVRTPAALILCAVPTAAVFAFLSARRKKQLAKLPPAPTVKVRAEEMARKLDSYRDRLAAQCEQIADAQTARTVRSLSTTLDLIADEVETDPKDRNKVRKLANHYCQMIADLVDKYILLEPQADTVTEGGNVAAALQQIRESLSSTDTALKKLLDDLFSSEAMEVSADINVLEQLLKTETAENKMDFSTLEL